MKKQTGFTLIELIMVIVILGILSAFALPRFANLSDNASEAAVEGARAAVASASAIVHAASLVAGNANEEFALVEVDGGTVAIVYGYPAVGLHSAAENSIPGNFDIVGAAQLNDFDTTTSTATVQTVTQEGTACSFTYTEATATAATPPVISPAEISDVTC